VRVAERHDAVANDQRHDRVSTPAAAVHGGHGGKDSRRCEALDVLALQFVRKDVQQRLGVGARVQVAPVLLTSSSFSSSELVRLPLWARPMP